MKDDDIIEITLPKCFLLTGNILQRKVWVRIVEELHHDAMQNRLNAVHVAEQKRLRSKPRKI